MTEDFNQIQKLVEEVTAAICDKYCKYPEEYKDQEKMMDEQCAHCPLCKL